MALRNAKLSEMRRRLPQRSVVGLHALWEEVERAPLHGPAGRALHHLRQAIRSLCASPLNSLLTILSSALVLVLFGLFLMFVDNVRGALTAQRGAVALSVYLRPEVTEQDRDTLHTELRKIAAVVNVEFVSAVEAFNRFRAALGDDAGVLEGLDPQDPARNPLPASFEVTFERSAAEDLEAHAQAISGKPGVEKVLFDRGFFAQVSDVLRSVTRAAWWGIPFLFLMVAFIIASTVRLSLHAHKDEIQIMRLVGARHRYVRTPFLIAAVLQGLLGALVSIAALLALRGVLAEVSRQSSAVQLLFTSEIALAWWVIALVLIAGVLTGLCASAITLRRFSVEV